MGHRHCLVYRVLLLVLPGIAWVAQGQHSRVGWGQGPYQREVIMVAGALSLRAEALLAQRQARPPAPAQAKPAGIQVS